jgi:hypothetical protein
MLQTRLDFISCTREFDTLDDIRTAIGWILSYANGDGVDRWEYLDDNGRQSLRVLRSVSGLLGWQKVVKSEDGIRYHLRLELPGQFCKVAYLIPLCHYLHRERFRITRLDICLDDYLRRVEFPLVKSAGDLGHYRLVESFKSIESAALIGDYLVGTCYFGKYDKVLRFYDAEFMHGIEADRWELQLRNDHARSAMALYLADPSCLAPIVVGSIDFGIPVDYYRQFRRFPWWQSLIDDASHAVSVSPGRYEPDLKRAIKWLSTSVAPTLAVLRDGLGSQFETLMIELCNDGSDRLKPYHREWIESIRLSQVDVYDFLVKK